MILERIVDAISMLLIAILALALEWDLFMKFINEKILSQLSLKADRFINSYFFCSAGLIIVLVITLAVFFMYKRGSHPVVVQVWMFIEGMIEGLLSIRNLKNPWLFIFYSFLIWGLYIYMVCVCYYSLPEKASLGFVSGLAIVFLGALAHLIAQGGIGAFPPTVGMILMLYAIPYDIGFAFGWVVWVVQTGGIIICGVAAFILVSRNFSRKQTVLGI